MAELASMIPLAGGQYNWVALLAPSSSTKFLSYLTGWITMIAWQACLAGSAFLGGTMIQGLLVLNNDNYVPERWHGTLLFYAIILFSLIINTYLARLLPKIEGMVLIIHVAGFVLMQQLIWVGKTIPDQDTMLASIGLNGSLGFAIVVATLFCLGDEQQALESPTGFPFIQVFLNATRSNAGASAMVSVIIIALTFAAVGSLATASRMLWAFAREQGLPGSSVLARVESRTLLPLYAIGLSTLISLALALINIGSTKAFNALTSLVVVSFYSSFALAAAVLLHRRLSRTSPELVYGPFNMGRAGVPVIVLSLVYSVIGIFFSCWPPTAQVDAVTMNWVVVVFGGALVFSMVFWVVHGRKVYTGPRWETSPEGSVMEGEARKV
ncbi:MAG: hypothetical protein Q9182_004361 [Xanthomendoza sp. 2 TL-2023]